MHSFKNAQDAFNKAVTDGRLSWDKSLPNYVGHYMYMGTKDGKDLFKHQMTREYLN